MAPFLLGIHHDNLVTLLNPKSWMWHQVTAVRSQASLASRANVTLLLKGENTLFNPSLHSVMASVIWLETCSEGEGFRKYFECFGSVALMSFVSFVAVSSPPYQANYAFKEMYINALSLWLWTIKSINQHILKTQRLSRLIVNQWPDAVWLALAKKATSGLG